VGYNAGNPDDVRKKEEQAHLSDIQELEDLKTIINTPAGMRYFRCFFEDSDFLGSSMTGNSMTYYNEGFKARAQLTFKQLMKVDSQKLIEVLKFGEEDVKDD